MFLKPLNQVEYFHEGAIGILGFAVLAIWFVGVSSFHIWFPVFGKNTSGRFFGFGIHCGFWFFQFGFLFKMQV